MKKGLLVLLFISGFAISVAGQEKMQEKEQDKLKDKDLPTAIQTSFKTDFPTATDAEWKMKDGHYKAHFKVEGAKQMAAYDATGKIVSKGVEIRENELPAAVSAAVKSGYANRSIDEVYKIEKDNTTTYLVKLNGQPQTKIMYSADGQVVKEKSHSHKQ